MATTDGDVGLQIFPMNVQPALRNEEPELHVEIFLRFDCDGLNDVHRGEFLNTLGGTFLIERSSLDSIVWIHQDLNFKDRALIGALRVRCARYTATDRSAELLAELVYSYFRTSWLFNTLLHSQLTQGRELKCLEHDSHAFRLFLPVPGKGSFILVSEALPSSDVFATAKYSNGDELSREQARNTGRICICELHRWSQQDIGMLRGLWKRLGDSFLRFNHSSRPTEIIFCAQTHCMKDMCDLRNLRLAIERVREDNKVLGRRALYHQLDALVVKPVVEYFNYAPPFGSRVRSSGIIDSGFVSPAVTVHEEACDKLSNHPKEDGPEGLYCVTPESSRRKTAKVLRTSFTKSPAAEKESQDIHDVIMQDLRGRSKSVGGRLSTTITQDGDGQDGIFEPPHRVGRDRKERNGGTSFRGRQISPGFAAALSKFRHRNNRYGSPTCKGPRRTRQRSMWKSPGSPSSSRSTLPASIADADLFNDPPAPPKPHDFNHWTLSAWHQSPTSVSPDYRVKRPYHNGVRVPVRGHRDWAPKPDPAPIVYDHPKPDEPGINSNQNASIVRDEDPEKYRTPSKYVTPKRRYYALDDDATPSDISDAGGESALYLFHQRAEKSTKGVEKRCIVHRTPVTPPEQADSAVHTDPGEV